jgi:hypothetical protein
MWIFKDVFHGQTPPHSIRGTGIIGYCEILPVTRLSLLTSIRRDPSGNNTDHSLMSFLWESSLSYCVVHGRVQQNLPELDGL